MSLFRFYVKFKIISELKLNLLVLSSMDKQNWLRFAKNVPEPLAVTKS